MLDNFLQFKHRFQGYKSNECIQPFKKENKEMSILCFVLNTVLKNKGCCLTQGVHNSFVCVLKRVRV